ncbi:MAG: sulfatase-like hydrolase/transferase [Vicinamibacterales bacterium]
MPEPDDRTRVFGRLRVHSWGGSTWLTEFALLTGLTHDDFGPSGNGVYYTVTPHLRYSLPRLLKRHGYRAIAISGVPKALYNMEAAQRDLGFDEVLNPLDFPEWGGKSLATHLISDQELGRYARQVLERSHDRPLLLFVLSMMQHGPYDSTHPVRYGLERTGLPADQAARTSDYVTRMLATNAAAKQFGAQLLASARPTVLAYFGDPQPNLETPLPYVPGVAAARYLTSYVVKSNVPAPAPPRRASPLDISFLGAVILEQAGVPLDPLFEANRSMRQLCDGRLTDCPDRARIGSYRARLYRDLQAASRR